ncbi:transcriptional regulator GutM [Terribacillus goriensis]|uniref:transcriptional regulator GutM n=1 Tax=Terribacillus saccharophilus TaxID=361277 RepID=UPI0039837C9F
MILLFIILLAVGFLLQSILGVFQIKNFNKHYAELRKVGRVAIGRSKGIFRSGAVLMLALDAKANIIQAEKMQGLTILARCKRVHKLEGQPLLYIDEDVIKSVDPFLRKALKDAQKTYEIIMSGGTVEKPKSPIQSIFGLFKINREVK